jgi:cytochrome oxidase Cu insertion factor (SCO1/SenC/PrrC family)
MGKNQRILTTILWALLVLGMVGVIGAGLWRTRDDEQLGLSDITVAQEQGLPVLFDAPAFALTDQNESPVTHETLQGNPWVAAFIFTNCAGPCPLMTAKMAQLQKAVPDPRLKLVSFTVDPERDTPAVLKAYAEKIGADPSRWHFLTGPKEAMFDAARGMKLAAGPATDDAPIFHSDLFVLIDGRGKVRGIYHSNEPDALDRLQADARTLIDNDSDIPGTRRG